MPETVKVSVHGDGPSHTDLRIVEDQKLDTIFQRVSIRKYENRSVEEEKIMQLLKAGMQAPSTGNQQPWEFYIVTDPSKLQELSTCSPYAGCAKSAPAALVPCYRTENLTFGEYAQIDLAISCENIWLEAASLGLGMVWLGIAPEEDRMKKVADIIGLPEGLKAFAVMPFGYPAESRKQQDRFDETRIHRI